MGREWGQSDGDGEGMGTNQWGWGGDGTNGDGERIVGMKFTTVSFSNRY